MIIVSVDGVEHRHVKGKGFSKWDVGLVVCSTLECDEETVIASYPKWDWVKVVDELEIPVLNVAGLREAMDDTSVWDHMNTVDVQESILRSLFLDRVKNGIRHMMDTKV